MPSSRSDAPNSAVVSRISGSAARIAGRLPSLCHLTFQSCAHIACKCFRKRRTPAEERRDVRTDRITRAKEAPEVQCYNAQTDGRGVEEEVGPGSRARLGLTRNDPSPGLVHSEI